MTSQNFDLDPLPLVTKQNQNHHQCLGPPRLWHHIRTEIYEAIFLNRKSKKRHYKRPSEIFSKTKVISGIEPKLISMKCFKSLNIYYRNCPLHCAHQSQFSKRPHSTVFPHLFCGFPNKNSKIIFRNYVIKKT